jgi:hypothetical protein
MSTKKDKRVVTLLEIRWYLEPKRVLHLKNPFWFQVEPFWVPCKALSTEGSTWNPKGLCLETKRVLLWGQLKNPFGTLISKSVWFG